jgi:hypothetical protein
MACSDTKFQIMGEAWVCIQLYVSDNPLEQLVDV